ncbi:uncharacterized protein DUF4440 [Roseiarcus fermentans]|uniref:Uncharacterized protein DUF4440 n=1 Tax=Roseiarcus fermentans TaxID=1473586 RepID=A0A366FCE4_9HYPH|nr:nuclear transport factor 2 family protein [Roseiarcus fermentans]RBP11375.1 uncharacterized protein DUF4440 [Roseiarcus fermentans]
MNAALSDPLARKGALTSLEEVERRRCKALMDGDVEALGSLLSDDLVHIHLTGKIDDKAGYLSGFKSKFIFKDVERGPLDIRVWDECAVMIGRLTQTIVVRETGERHDIRAVTSQTWRRVEGRWLQTTCHNAPVSD